MEPEWERIIREQSLSGMTIDAFCGSRGINRYTFKRHKYRRNAGVARAEVPRFIEVTGGSSRSFVLRLKNGRALEIPSGFEEGEVRRLVGVVESC
jgi:hypothetical protein